MDPGDAGDPPGNPSGGARRGTLLAAATSVDFAQFGARVVVSPFALVQFPIGVLADRYGERPVVLLSMGLTTSGAPSS